MVLFHWLFFWNATKWTWNAFLQSGKKTTKDNLTQQIFEGLYVSFNKSLMMMMQIIFCFDFLPSKKLSFKLLQTFETVKFAFSFVLNWEKMNRKGADSEILPSLYIQDKLYAMPRRCVKKSKWSYFPIQFESEKCKYWWRWHSTPFPSP